MHAADTIISILGDLRMRLKYGSNTFPLELFKKIIDNYRLGSDEALASPLQISETYRTLRTCAAVCSEWLPYVRNILHTVIVLQSSGQTRLLVRTLSAHPDLAKHVYVLRIEPKDNVGDGYIPLFELPTFPNARSLVFHLDWTHYPDQLLYMVPRLYPGAERVYILRDSFTTDMQLLRFIRGFGSGSSLRHLHISPQSLAQNGSISGAARPPVTISTCISLLPMQMRTLELPVRALPLYNLDVHHH